MTADTSRDPERDKVFGLHNQLFTSPTRPLIFISDLHLRADMQKTIQAFETFLVQIPMQVQAIFILGDLFDYWVGDDMLRLPFAQRIATRLATLKQHRVQLYLMRGNRDCMLGAKFAQSTGAIVLPDPFICRVFGHTLVLMHGDLLCTTDYVYQRYRRIVQSTWFQKIFLSCPLPWRIGMAQKLRNYSQKKHTQRIMPIDVDQMAVNKIIELYQATLIIHGHTHLPKQHLCINNAQRWVLPDWDYEHPVPRGGYIVLDAAGVSMHKLI